jgi:hypothetical protein
LRLFYDKVSWTADEIMDCKVHNKAPVTTAVLRQEIKYVLYNQLHYLCDTECTCTALVVKIMLSLYLETHNMM